MTTPETNHYEEAHALYEEVIYALRESEDLLRIAAISWGRVVDLEGRIFRLLSSVEGTIEREEREIALASLKRAVDTAKILWGLRDLHAVKDHLASARDAQEEAHQEEAHRGGAPT